MLEINNQPLVSVVIPCYNHEQFVQDSIQSVIDQSYPNIELIIIDDGSKDGSVEKIQQMISLCEERFTRFEFRSRPNKGLSATLNEALDWCQGEYFAAVASDDIYLNNKINLQVSFLNENQKVVAVFGGVELIDTNNNIISTLKGTGSKYSFEQIILHRHVLYSPTQLIRLNFLKEVGCYKSGMLIEDWYMWLKLSEIGDLYCMTELLCKYRQHESNTSRNYQSMYLGRLQVLEEFKNYSLYDYAILDVEWMYIYDLSNKRLNFKCIRFILTNIVWFKQKIIRKFNKIFSIKKNAL